MTTQSVKTQAANLFGSQSTIATKKGKQPGAGFEALINNNMKLSQNINVNKDSTTVKKIAYQKADSETKANDKAENYAKDTADVEKKEAVSKDSHISESKSSSSLAEEAKEVNTTATSKVKTQDTDDKELLISEIAGMMQAISEVVMQALNLTEEELHQLLEDQGMNISDLLDPESLQQLLLANNGETDILAVLTDENLAKQMNELLGQVEEIISETELGLTKEQIKDLLAQAEQKLQNEVFTEIGITDGKKADVKLTSNQPEAANAIRSSLQEEGTVTLEGSKDINASTLLTEETKDSYSDTQQDATDKEMGAEEHFQTFIDNLVKSTGEAKMDASGNMVQATELREIANQIIERIKVSITQDQTSMELQLNPENLGKVNLTVQSKNGVMTAQFVVQNEVTKEAIESQMHILRESLNEQGIKVEAIEVTVSNYTFDHTGQDQGEKQSDSKNNTTGKKITLEEALAMVDNPEEEVADEVTLGIGSQVDYTA